MASRSICAAGLVLSLLVASVTGADDDIRGPLDKALAEHEVAVGKAVAQLDRAFLEAIKRAANDEQLAELRKLLDARDDFVKSRTLTKIPRMKEAIASYVKARSESAHRVYTAYRKAIAAAAGKILVEEAKALTEEMQRFVNRERGYIGLPPKYKLDDAKTPEKKALPTDELILDIMKQVRENWEEIAKLDTQAKQVAAHAEFIKKLNDRIKRKRFVLHFPVKDVKFENGRRSVTVVLDTPDELIKVPENESAVFYGIEDTLRSGGWKLTLRAKDIDKIDTRHSIRVTGHGKLVVEQWTARQPPGTVAILAFDRSVGGNRMEYLLVVTEPKIRMVSR